MKYKLSILLLMVAVGILTAQDVMTTEKMLELKKISSVGITDDGQYVTYKVYQYNLKNNETKEEIWTIPIGGGEKVKVDKISNIRDKKISSDNQYKLYHDKVKIDKVLGQDLYQDVPNSNVYVYNDLNYRHWDTWEDGNCNHIFVKNLKKTNSKPVDILKNESYDCPTEPFGGTEDYTWHPNGKQVLYVCKKLTGVDYAQSTNTDIYQYNIETRETKNLTLSNKGYDTNPTFSSKGQLAWLQMKRDGYEADKNDIITIIDGQQVNLTDQWDGTVSSFIWSNDAKNIYFVAPVAGTMQIFTLKNPRKPNKIEQPKQLTQGQFNIQYIVGQSENNLVVARCDMNHPTELYVVNVNTGAMTKLTHENDDVYNNVALGKVEKRMVKTTDNKEMLTWVIYPPNFDKTKKYPTLLYCQGGPQSEVSQFFSYRWNFQQMAAHGYVVVAPNRRGLPGFGVEWNEQISKDYGGQNIKDYLSAIDDVAKEPYVDKNRLGCIGASYGGYSVYFLAGHHQGRFKTFIAHDGIFNEQSMYGTTEEVFFVNWDLGGSYWDKTNKIAQKAYHEFNPISYVDKWDSPILIIQGGRDYRVPTGQALEAFQVARLRGLKSRLMYFPKENHWVLDSQNSLVWHREFYKWLKETL